MADGQAVETVVFDLGGVLIDWNPRYLYRTMFDDPAVMEHFLTEVATGHWNEKFDAGRTMDEGIAELLAVHPHLEVPLKAWKDRWIEMIKGPIPGTVTILEELAANGTHLVALTNWSIETFPLVHKDEAGYPFFRHFDNVYVSGELKLIKPDPRIFAHVEQDLGKSGDRLLFIDDNAANIAAAEARGWRAHRFTDADSLRACLEKLDLLDRAA
ncbi:MAG TPA: HAD-IA family hydrolase [Geminicoccus sp.]|uniref:HAD-IA family hydrolase n=1 Tax=Geminicoccus sp. TaxID=2024832 RepID=UPI002E3601FE|nr:HAD-IA family hydrolase [Geminicoccus sp.]HEX2525246.1 HAD-IA family hydrolase [Geminicoccus sp.]